MSTLERRLAKIEKALQPLEDPLEVIVVSSMPIWKGSDFGGSGDRTGAPRIADRYLEGKTRTDESTRHKLALEDIGRGLALIGRGESTCSAAMYRCRPRIAPLACRRLTILADKAETCAWAENPISAG